jgi:hypothetical protein
MNDKALNRDSTLALTDPVPTHLLNIIRNGEYKKEPEFVIRKRYIIRQQRANMLPVIHQPDAK